MNTLEEDHTYLVLQRRLEQYRWDEEQITKRKQEIMQHINAIKRDYYQYELDNKDAV